MSNIGETTLEIDLNALAHNYAHIKSKILPQTKFLAVVKAFAYGSDMVTVAKKLEDLGVDYFAVAYTQEGILLRDADITTPILVLHPQPTHFGDIIERCLEPSLYSKKILKEFAVVAERKNQKDYPVHIKFNTGLNRLGFREEDVNYLLEELGQSQNVQIKSIFSHLAASDDLDESAFTKSQINSFERISNKILQKLSYKPHRHLLNTSGILNFPHAQYDMVRSGIGLYGYGNDAQVDKELKPVASLKTIVSQIHRINPGESVGYNRSYTASKPVTTATLPLGHADGIGRQYGNGKGCVIINGKKAPIIGNVCMDMIMVKVEGIDCKEGDEAIIFGAQHSAEIFASGANTISYEILTAISQRVKRVVIGA